MPTSKETRVRVEGLEKIRRPGLARERVVARCSPRFFFRSAVDPQNATDIVARNLFDAEKMFHGGRHVLATDERR